MANISLVIKKSTREVSVNRSFAGVQMENLQDKFVVSFSDEFVDGSASLEYEVNGESYFVDMTKENESYTLDIEQILISEEGRYPFQVRIVDGESVFKSKVFYLKIYPSLNAQDFPPSYTSWKDWVIEYVSEHSAVYHEGNGIDISSDNIISIDENVVATKSDLNRKQDTLISGTNIKKINGNSVLGSGNLNINTYQPFNSNWKTDGTTLEFCANVNADSNAVQGMAYLGDVYFSDLPFNGNADAVVEITHGTGTSGKVIHITITSGNIAPYHWEYTYWNNGSSHTPSWIGYQQELVSGTNIKSINNQSLLGAGDLTIEGETDYNKLDNIPIENVSSETTYSEGGYYKSAEEYKFNKFVNGEELSVLNDRLYIDTTKNTELNHWLSNLTYIEIDTDVEYRPLIQFDHDSALWLFKFTIDSNPVYVIIIVTDNFKIIYGSEAGSFSIDGMTLTWTQGWQNYDTTTNTTTWYLIQPQEDYDLTIKLLYSDADFWNGNILGSGKTLTEGSIKRYDNSELNEKLFDSNVIIDLGLIDFSLFSGISNPQTSFTKTLSDDDLELLKNNDIAYAKIEISDIYDSNVKLAYPFYFRMSNKLDMYARDTNSHTYTFRFEPISILSTLGKVNLVIENKNASIEISDGKTRASDITSESATNGQVLTADGSGGASWQNVSGGSQLYMHCISIENSANGIYAYFNYISKSSTPTTKLVDLCDALITAGYQYKTIICNGISNNTYIKYAYPSSRTKIEFYYGTGTSTKATFDGYTFSIVDNVVTL